MTKISVKMEKYNTALKAEKEKENLKFIPILEWSTYKEALKLVKTLI